MKTKLLILMLCFMLAAATVSAGELEITQVDVTVDGDKDKNVGANSTVGPEADSESTVKFDVTLENTYTRDEDIEIQDVEVTVVIYDIDDGDDLEETADQFDLRADRDKEVSIDFTLPLRMDEGEYDVEIQVQGEDENGTEYDFIYEVVLEVEKQRNNIVIRRAELSQTEFECSGEGRVFVEILNLGRDEEEEVTLEVKSDALGINFKQTDLDLTEDLFDEDSGYEVTVPFKITEDVEAKSYQVMVKVYYDDDKLDDQETLTVLVKDCATDEPEPEPTPDEEEEEVEVIVDNETEDVMEEDTETTVVTTPTPTVIAPRQKNFWDEYGLLTIIILANIIAIIIAVWLVTLLMKK